MKSLRNKRTTDLGMSAENLKKLTAKPSLKQFKIFHEKLVAVEQAKFDLTLKQPIYVAFAIPDLSKTLIYEFHYNYIKQRYPKSTLLFTDTDFLTYQIQTDNVYKYFYAIKHLFVSGMRKKVHSTMMKKKQLVK